MKKFKIKSYSYFDSNGEHREVTISKKSETPVIIDKIKCGKGINCLEEDYKTVLIDNYKNLK